MKNYDFNKIDFDYDNDYTESMSPIMMRQRHKTQLLLTTNFQLENLSKDMALYGKKYRKVQKDLFKDYFLGVKMINEKNPVFIEMPTLKEDNGKIIKFYGKKAKNKSLPVSACQQICEQSQNCDA